MMLRLTIALACLALASPAAACESDSQVSGRETVVFACPDNPLPKMQDRVPKAKTAAVKKPAPAKPRKKRRKRK